MKKAIITVVLVIGMIANTFGQLNSNAEFFKGMEDQTSYKELKDRAVDKWADNHKMVVYEINKQADSTLEVMDILDKGGDREIMITAMGKWNDIINGKKNYNWAMILYEYKKQIKASNSY